MYFLLKDFLHYLSLEKSLIRTTQINILLDEFLYLIDNDIVFNSSFRKKANEIIFDIKNNKKELDNDKLKRNLEIIFKNLSNNNSYIKSILGILNSYLLSNNYNLDYEKDYEKNIKKLKKVSFIFIDFLKNEVWISRKYLDFIRKSYLNNIDLKNNFYFEKWLSKFSKLFFSPNKLYNIYFKINIWDIQANKKKIEKKNIKFVIEKISNSNILYIDNIENKLSWIEIKSDFLENKKDFIWKKDNNIFYLCVKIEWKDIHSIYKIAKSHINKLFDTFLYEFNALKLIIFKNSLISDEDRIYVINDLYNEYINRKKWNEHNIISLNKILNNENYHIDTKSKISNSIKYYKLFLSSENSEVKLLNLWIALESLFSNVNNNENSFEKLKSFIPKLISMNLMKNYFDEFQNFILHKIDMENENNSKYKNHTEIKNIIQGKNKTWNKNNWKKEEKFNNVWIFKIFNQGEFEKIKELLQNEYFIQKYNRLYKIIYKDDNWNYKNLLTYLKWYENKIKWILTKIYRYRNYIVHWWKKIDTEEAINDLEFLYLELIDDILEKIWTDYLLISSLDEYFSRTNRSYNIYEKWINTRLKNNNIIDVNIVLPLIVY